jgi:hypothetical protein
MVLLEMLQDSVVVGSESGESISINWWMWIAFGELLLIIRLLYGKRNSRRRAFSSDDLQSNILDRAKANDIDMNGVMASITSSRELYKLLSGKCHPDRFLDATIKKKAEEIFQEISSNKRNYSKLLELKEIAQSELNIKL